MPLLLCFQCHVAGVAQPNKGAICLVALPQGEGSRARGTEVLSLGPELFCFLDARWWWFVLLVHDFLIYLPEVTKECFLEAFKYLETSKQHPFETPGYCILSFSVLKSRSYAVDMNRTASFGVSRLVSLSSRFLAFNGFTAPERSQGVRNNKKQHKESGIMYQDLQRNAFWLVLCNKKTTKKHSFGSWYKPQPIKDAPDQSWHLKHLRLVNGDPKPVDSIFE